MMQLVADLSRSGAEIDHPLLAPREEAQHATLLVLTANRGMCAGYNSNVMRLATSRYLELKKNVPELRLEVSGKKGIAALRFRRVPMDETYTHFEDKPRFDEVDVLALRYLEEYTSGRLDRLDVVYTKLITSTKQEATVETLLPLASLSGGGEDHLPSAAGPEYEFLPSPESIIEEVVPASFRASLFKCFLDAAVSEQIARMVAMKAATENADEMIRLLSTTYNRARQSQITSEITEIIGGVEALK